jgi:hypothetical protein
LLGGVRTVVEGVRTDNCVTGFSNLLEILSRIEPRLDGCTSAALNFYIKDWRVRTITAVIPTVNLMHAISIYMSVRTMKTIVRDVEL